MTEQGFSGERAAEIVGITYRQLDYWARTDLVRPSLADAKGSGTQRRYSYRDLLELKVIKSLLDAGISLQSARKVFEYLRENLGEDVAIRQPGASTAAARCWPARRGDRRPAAPGPGRAQHRCRSAGVKDEVDAAIIELRPAADRPTPADAVGAAAAAGSRAVRPLAGRAAARTSGSRFAHNVRAAVRQAARLLRRSRGSTSPARSSSSATTTASPTPAFTPDFYLPGLRPLHRGHHARPEAGHQEEPQGAAAARAAPRGQRQDPLPARLPRPAGRSTGWRSRRSSADAGSTRPSR